MIRIIGSSGVFKALYLGVVSVACVKIRVIDCFQNFFYRSNSILSIRGIGGFS